MGLCCQQHRRLAPIIYLGDIFELKQVCEADGMIEVGAAVPMPISMTGFGRHWPDFGERIRRRVRSRSAMPAPWAATSPTVRRSATGRRLDRALGASLIMRAKAPSGANCRWRDYFLDYGKCKTGSPANSSS